MERITSRQNARVKAWRKLLSARGRRKEQAYLIEGEHLIQEAVQSAVPLKEWMVTREFQAAHPDFTYPAGEGVIINESVASSIATTQTPQGIFAVAKMPEQKQASDWKPTGDYYLLLDQVQDPGNLGTMIRTADAAGFDGVILGQGTVDLYNDKVIRSTQGSLWHLEVVSLKLDEAVTQLQAAAIPVYASELNPQAKSYLTLTQTTRAALILGNEGQGVSAQLIDQADAAIYIPMPGQSESLNVSVAAGILMYKLIEPRLN